MKTSLCCWRLLPALTLLLGCPSWLDAAEPKKRPRQSSRPPSEIKQVFDRIGDFFAHAARDLEERDRRDPFDDPFFEPQRFRPQPYPMPGSGMYPVHPELEDYFLYRHLNPYDRPAGRPTPQQPQPRQRQSMTFPPPGSNHPYLPFYQTLGRENVPKQQPSGPLGSAPSYQPLTPSAAGEVPRLDSEATRTEAPPNSSPTLSAPPTQNAPTNPAPTGLKKPPVLTNLPTAKPVPGRPGLVYPPGAEEVPGNMVDVRGFVAGQKVKDPHTGKIFLVP